MASELAAPRSLVRIGQVLVDANVNGTSDK